MPQGTQISGEDGIIELLDDQGAVIGEIPCLKKWDLNVSANLSSRSTRCMLSNDDGGSDSSGGWEKSTLQSKSWEVSLEFFWQEDENIPASLQLDPTNVGDKLKVRLYPNKDSSGKISYQGDAFIQSAPITSDVDGDVMTTVSLKGTGGITKAAVA